MISITKKFKAGLIALVGLIVILSSCNKEVENFPFTNDPPATTSIVETLTTMPSDSLYRRLIIRAGLSTTLSNRTLAYTIFVVDNAAMRAFIDVASGGATVGAPDAVYSGFISTTLPVSTAASIVNYYLVPQRFTTSEIVHQFPSLELLNNITVLPGNLIARLRVHVSRNPSTSIYYVNNVPLTAPDLMAGLSVIHHMGALIPPPQRMIWERINTDTDLTIFKAAIQRADSGYTPATPGSLIGGMQNFGANFTVMAPSNAAMKAAISFLTGGAIPPTAPDATFIGFLGSASVSTLLVKGLAVYHLLGKRTSVGAPVSPIKAFTVNVPTTPISVLTFLNNPGPGVNHPGVIMQATFTGPSATALTVKGLANPTASNVAINPTPDLRPSYGSTPVPVTYTGTSDQNYINGVLHKIDQVLFPQ